MARVQLGESRLKARRLRRRVIISSFISFLVLALCGALVALSWAPFMRITDVSVEGVRAVDAAVLTESVWQDLRGGYGYLFARSNIFLYPKETIIRNLTQNFSTIKTVTVEAEDFHTISVAIVERKPTALYCGDSAASSTGCYFLDEQGLAYAPAALYSGDAYQKYYGTLGHAESAHGQFLRSEQFHALPALIESLQKTIAAEVSTVSIEEEDIHVTFANTFVLIFGLEDERGGLLERLSLALSAAPFTTHELADFEYLDLRFGDKVYYKLKGQ